MYAAAACVGLFSLPVCVLVVLACFASLVCLFVVCGLCWCSFARVR